ncbi:protealysin inhibitor emfourin [Streptomyces sp. NPDC006670]|uniref:protealysin inhibitor emfourin n=1 Tax=unclassified Streptomyces TaxID=2593676 RepID=UPI0033CE6AF5
MKIEVVRTGGFAGIERRAEVDTSGRPDEQEWRDLAELALTPHPLAAEGPGGVRDGFAYLITVDGRTVSCQDPHLTDAQRGLITRVLKEGA